MTEKSNGKEQINLVVSRDRKREWEEEVSRSNGKFSSLSQLIRYSVAREIGEEDTTTSSTDDLKNHLSQVTETIQQLDQRLEDIEHRLASIDQRVSEDPAIRELASELFEYLPTKDEITAYEKARSNAGTDAFVPENVARKTDSGEIQAFEDALDEPEHRIKKALSKLQQDTHQVHTMEFDGKTRYFKEG